MFFRISKLIERLKDNDKTLTHLHFNGALSGAMLGTKGVQRLAEVLPNNTVLQTLELTACIINDISVYAIASALKKNTALRKLGLGSTRIDDRGIHQIGDALLHNSSLEELDISYNNINSKGAEAIATVLLRNTSLKRLDFSANFFANKSVYHILRALHHNTTLKQLNLSESVAGNDSVLAELTEALSQNSTLEQLDLSFNHLGNISIPILAEGLKRNRGLRQLDLRCNRIDNIGIDNTGLEPLIQALEKNTTLTELNLVGNFFDEKQKNTIDQLLTRNHQIAMAFSSENPFDVLNQTIQNSEERMHFNSLCAAVYQADLDRVKAYIDRGLQQLREDKGMYQGYRMAWGITYKQNLNAFKSILNQYKGLEALSSLYRRSQVNLFCQNIYNILSMIHMILHANGMYRLGSVPSVDMQPLPTEQSRSELPPAYAPPKMTDSSASDCNERDDFYHVFGFFSEQNFPEGQSEQTVTPRPGRLLIDFDEDKASEKSDTQQAELR